MLHDHYSPPVDLSEVGEDRHRTPLQGDKKEAHWLYKYRRRVFYIQFPPNLKVEANEDLVFRLLEKTTSMTELVNQISTLRHISGKSLDSDMGFQVNTYRGLCSNSM